jgi:hypothetical protein
MQAVFSILVVTVIFSFSNCAVYAQEEISPLKIKINRIVFTPGNKYSVYVPTFEFHIIFQKDFNVVKSAITADYDYRRQDMGFGMSHALYKYVINPGITVEDNLFFRKVFSDSTGVWRRNQAIKPFFYHKLNAHSTIGIEFKFEREWSPNRRMGTKIISNLDRSITVYYLFQKTWKNIWENEFYYVSLERSYRILKGEFNYFLLDTFFKRSIEVNTYLNYKFILSLRGNLTSQNSPLFFIGGHSTLIGYENDEFWGRRVFYFQNLFEIKPFPAFNFSIRRTNFRRISYLTQIDVGQVRGFPKTEDLKKQNTNIKVGIGLGLGVTTDLPFMPNTTINLIVSSPSSDPRNLKYYAGFGGWID